MGQQLSMGDPRPRELRHELALADGSNWEIVAGNAAAASIVSRLGDVMQFRAAASASETFQRGNVRQLHVRVDVPKSVADCYVPLASRDDGAFVCVLCPCAHWGGSYINLVKLSLVFARAAQGRGGFLIHGALAERDGMGVILTAPGGTGKTTASNRLPAPWRSLCDDTTLVLPDAQGNYWAHPWPTWSRFIDDGPGGTWDVQSAVPLKGIFFLSQALEDRVERVGPGQAVSLLMEGVKQASMSMEEGMPDAEHRALNLERFDNLCALARAIPMHVLALSLTGAFWQEIELALAWGHGARGTNDQKHQPGLIYG